MNHQPGIGIGMNVQSGIGMSSSISMVPILRSVSVSVWMSEQNRYWYLYESSAWYRYQYECSVWYRYGSIGGTLKNNIKTDAVVHEPGYLGFGLSLTISCFFQICQNKTGIDLYCSMM